METGALFLSILCEIKDLGGASSLLFARAEVLGIYLIIIPTNSFRQIILGSSQKIICMQIHENPFVFSLSHPASSDYN